MSVMTEEILKKDFGNFLSAGMKIVVHSSLSSLGYVDGGAPTVIKALMDTITYSGLIMMPTFTYGREPYDPYSTVAQTGKIPESFRLMQGVSRSMHPTHSFCAWGKDAQAILSGHEVVEPFKRGTPLEKFSRQGGYVLLIGVTQTANSLIHVAQELAGLPYLDRPKTVLVKESGELKEVVARRAGCSLGFDKISPFLEKEKLIQEYKVAEAKVFFINAEEVLNKAIEVLRDNPYTLVCDNQDCFACNEMKNFTKSDII